MSIESSLVDFETAVKEEGVKKYAVKLAVLLGAYIATAHLGLSLSFTFDQITTIWPPTGIAIAAILLWGYHYWPSIFVGAFIANAINGALLPAAAAIAFGNTVEAIVAVLVIKRFIPNQKVLDSISSAMAFVVGVCLLSTMISATFGVSSLVFSDVLKDSEIIKAWITWWTGDMIGALVIIPFVIAWRSEKYRRQLQGHAYEALALGLLVIMFSLIIFSQPAQDVDKTLPLVYLVFPLVTIAAVRFTQIGAVTAGTIITVLAIGGTVNGTGPYIGRASIEQNLFSLHFFILVVMITALVLSVAVDGRLRSEAALYKQGMELKEVRKLALRTLRSRRDLEEQVGEATDQINKILTGIFENEGPSKQSNKLPPGKA